MSSSRMTAVQSVYIEPQKQIVRFTIVGLGVLLALCCAPVFAGVEFTGCTDGPDGSVTCNTEPTGNTLTDEMDARFDLDSEASPGWSEFNPDQGFDDDFGDNET